jgi:hypothetical protein
VVAEAVECVCGLVTVMAMLRQQPLSAHKHGDEVTVRARLTGDFPGSPVEVSHSFKLSGEKIVSLEIRS